MNPIPSDFNSIREGRDEVSVFDLVMLLVKHGRLLTIGPLLAGVVAIGATYLMDPTFTSRALFLPPQQQQSLTSSALASLGSLAGLAGGAVSRSPADQYVALMQSTTVAERMIERFDLMRIYETQLRSDARRVLGANTRIGIGKKDGLITIEVDDREPKRAADMANGYIEELRSLSASLALTEAQQRRAFFEGQLSGTRDRLARAQRELQGSGFNPDALKSEPRAVAEAYAQLQAQVAAAEIRLQMLRRGLTDTAPEVEQQTAALTALRTQLTRAESPTSGQSGGGYVARYREFKYQETLFEIFSRQYEMARLDEAREAALIQIIDAAAPADRRTSPKRTLTGLVTATGILFVLTLFVLLRDAWRRVITNTGGSRAGSRLRADVVRRQDEVQ